MLRCVIPCKLQWKYHEYLQFRSDYVSRDPNSHKVKRKSLVGKYLTDTDDLPDVCDEHEFITDRLINDPEEFSISRLLHEYLEKIEVVQRQ